MKREVLLNWQTRLMTLRDGLDNKLTEELTDQQRDNLTKAQESIHKILFHIAATLNCNFTIPVFILTEWQAVEATNERTLANPDIVPRIYDQQLFDMDSPLFTCHIMREDTGLSTPSTNNRHFFPEVDEANDNVDEAPPTNSFWTNLALFILPLFLVWQLQGCMLRSMTIIITTMTLKVSNNRKGFLVLLPFQDCQVQMGHIECGLVCLFSAQRN
jgi:hypothetical protein